MSSRETLFEYPKAAFAETELARRIALAAEDYPEQEKGKPHLLRLLGELDLLIEPARRVVRRLDIPQAKRPQTIILMPGFATGPTRMRYMARNLEKAGHRTKRWGLGRNWGVAADSLTRLEQRLDEICTRYDAPVALVGWSLGGLYARELAKRRPECISRVITMGSPFSGSPRANNVWRVYQAIAGHRVDQVPIDANVSVKPPVETIALWSPSDGAIAPRSAAGLPGERDRAIALRCTHAGFTYSPEAILTVLAELDRAQSN
ncbi:esterase/lipase family protein [Qipengyuania sp. ASV99]|uniref:esterase/lipase family protein n=1 Tax=Qipengyuania sp. ASV99 TaxID=3399681 RepID=UPI003A4C83C8